MKTDLAKWELGILLQNRHELLEQGRSTDYDSDNRMKKLREFLDSEVDSKPEQTETKTTTSPINEPPF